ncbi:aminotransferase class IV [Candidatus Pelagibacter sp. HIMB1506]|uniref:aminotransferase class IV n=1 Tax=Candidatus Pelagibacter sp. HIMB1506 TaxID=3413337 RepID=UPI003F86750D
MKQNNILNTKYSTHKKMIVYINGKFIKSEDAKISIYDLGFTNGEMIYDTFRTFNKKPYHVDFHLKRLWETSRYTGIKINLTKKKIKLIIKKILSNNKKYIGKNDDLWCFMRFTRSGSSIIEMNRIKFENYSKYYTDGLRLHTSKIRRTPEICVDPRGKIAANYVNLSLAREEVWKFDRQGNAILLDLDKNINEGYGFNIFFVKGKKIFTPKDEKVLNGVVRHFIEIISKKNNLKFIKKNIKLNEAYKADECFITATGWGICPIRSLDKKKYFKKIDEYKVLNLIQNEYSKIVGLDFVKQYLKF